MSDANNSQPDREPDRIYRAGGKEFRIYTEYNEELDDFILDFPDFEANPEYTDEGRPFASSAQSGCQYSNPPGCYDCGSCEWFFREKDSKAVISVCMCDERRMGEAVN